jgi:hypothetical protein
MGNFITDTLGKMAGNVTQSVVSALIVTAITTYLLVDFGKKGSNPSATDSAKTATAVAPERRSDTGAGARSSTQKFTDTASPQKSTMPGTNNQMTDGGSTKGLPVGTTEGKTTREQAVSPVTNASSAAFKELPSENPTEQKLESTITEGRAKGDSLLKAHPQDQKLKEVKKETPKEVKDVKKRADEVFDELDQEGEKKPVQ